MTCPAPPLQRTREPGVGNFLLGFSSRIDGPAQLLNGPETRGPGVDAWLKAAGLPRTACGHWYFHLERISHRMRSAVGDQNGPIV